MSLPRYEFASVEWVAEIASVVRDGLRNEDLAGIDYSFSEEYTDAPVHLRRDGRESIGWHIRITEGKVAVEDGPLEDAMLRLVGDYETIRPLARMVLADDPAEATRAALMLDMAKADGRLAEYGDRGSVPPVLRRLNIHDAIARRTA